jgi:peptide/nickel transport system substrate-binding protein
VPDDDIAFEKMKSGESDTANISPEKLEEAKKIDLVNVYEWWSPAASWSYVAYNMREGIPTHDIRVRHAINYAVDKDLLTEEVMVGQGKRMCSVYPDTLWVYTPDVPCYDYNPEKAIELMTEAGYTFKDGKMLDKKGEQLKLKFIYGPNTSKVRELIALTVQDYLAEIGIEVEIQALEWASFLEAKSAEKPDWDMLTATWGGVLEPHIMFSLWTEDAIPDLNPAAYINKKLEATFEEAGGTYDTAIRKAKYQEAQKILAEDSPYMFLFYSKTRSAQNKRIQGIEPKIVGIDWNSNDWYIVEKEQP